MQLVISDAQKQWLEQNSDSLRSKSAIVRDLIDSARLGVDRPFTLAERPAAEGRGASTSSSIEVNTSIDVNKTKTRAKPKDPFSGRQLPENAIPNDLLDCQQLLEEF